MLTQRFLETILSTDGKPLVAKEAAVLSRKRIGYDEWKRRKLGKQPHIGVMDLLAETSVIAWPTFAETPGRERWGVNLEGPEWLQTLTHSSQNPEKIWGPALDHRLKQSAQNRKWALFARATRVSTISKARWDYSCAGVVPGQHRGRFKNSEPSSFSRSCTFGFPHCSGCWRTLLVTP